MAVITTAGYAPDEPIAWLAVCPGEADAASSYRTIYDHPTGARTTLLVSDTAPAATGCTTVRVPVAAKEIVWARLESTVAVKRLAGGFMLQGGTGAGPSPSSEIIPLDEPAPPPIHTGSPAAPPERTPVRDAHAAPGAVNAPKRALWIWRPELWRNGGELPLARAAAWQADTIYIAVPTTPAGEVIAADELRRFLHEATRRGLRIWAVDGDPRAVLPSERPSFETRARAYAAFNAAAPGGTHDDGSGARLAGIQYDIEPYLVAGYHLDEDGWKDAYIATIATLARAAAGMPIEVAVPFWWLDTSGGGTSFADRLAPSIASIAIMDYRTDAALIERFARPWLAWGERHRKRIRVALEAGPIGDEPRYHFRPAAAGSLWQVTIGSHQVLLLLASPAANPSGAAFARVGQSMSSGAAQTFQGKIGQLRAMLPDLERTFAASTAFGGIALHEVPDVDPDR